MRGDHVNKQIPGYLTVEAALVMPIVLWTVIVVIYLQFFQYDRCRMDQDAGLLSVWGTSLQLEQKEDRMKELKSRAASLSEEAYLAWENEDWKLQMEQDKLAVERTGSLQFLFAGWGSGDLQEKWETTIKYENRWSHPVSFMRSWRKIKGWMSGSTKG